MEVNKAKITNKFSSLSNFSQKKFLTLDMNNSMIHSEYSRQTAGFDNAGTDDKKLNSFSIKHDMNNISNLNHKIYMGPKKSGEFTIQDIKNKSDISENYTNINISIVNPNFSINNYDSNSGTNLTHKKLNINNIVNNTIISLSSALAVTSRFALLSL